MQFGFIIRQPVDSDNQIAIISMQLYRGQSTVSVPYLELCCSKHTAVSMYCYFFRSVAV